MMVTDDDHEFKHLYRRTCVLLTRARRNRRLCQIAQHRQHAGRPTSGRLWHGRGLTADGPACFNYVHVPLQL
jgi:hypothetical protein